ncbi:MAG: hypothetical protein A2148_02910 [Chloroflexi bacterium RBG_16_68_14]|nr:MAG: hypothetical protein A2148_02910 [Chloroflexi bacterium RBG_16_68_14]
MQLAGLVVAEDLATAACGLLNAGYFAAYWWRRNGSRGRRIGAAALALVGGAAVVEAIFSQALFWSQQEVGLAGQLSPGLWALARLPLFAATLSISVIILRRLLS